MKKCFFQLKSLSRKEWQVLLASLILLPITALALYVIGFKTTRDIMARSLSPEPVGKALETKQLSEARAVARMVAIAACFGIYRGANCLKKSLVLWWLLGRRGIPSKLKIGVNREGAGVINAHAWVECADHALNDSEDVRQRFSVFELG